MVSVISSKLGSYGWPQFLIHPLVKVVEDIVVCCVSVATSSKALATMLLEELVGQFWDLLKGRLPVACFEVSLDHAEHLAEYIR